MSVSKFTQQLVQSARLEYVLGSHWYTTRQLCAESEYHPSQNLIANIISGQHKSIPHDLAMSICNLFDVEYDWITATDFDGDDRHWSNYKKLGVKSYAKYNGQQVFAVFPDGNYPSQKAIMVAVPGKHSISLLLSQKNVPLTECPVLIFDQNGGDAQ